MSEITLEQAIEILREKYAESENLPFVNDRVSYAIYHTWREVAEKICQFIYELKSEYQKEAAHGT